MTLAIALNDLQVSAAQCDSLIANSHKTDPAGTFIHTQIDKEQIVSAAFLNLFIAWETFLEDALTQLMIGNPTISGSLPIRYVSPPNLDAAKGMLIGINKYFDFANHEYMKKVASLYFENAYPFEPHLSSICHDLADMRTMRNAAAHLTSTTQDKLNVLAQRIFTTPRPGISLYTFLVSPHPQSSIQDTVYKVYRDKLVCAAGLIASG